MIEITGTEKQTAWATDIRAWISGDLRQWSETSMGICDRDLKHTFPVRPETVGQFTGVNPR